MLSEICDLNVMSKGRIFKNLIALIKSELNPKTILVNR
jgi:hypothetical protein